MKEKQYRKHMNHSAAFYEEVGRVLPEYRKCEKWLKENGSLYILHFYKTKEYIGGTP